MPAPTRVIYLDVDDEITSAAARVRTVEAARVALVIPPGSRVATSRINFRLLARDATTHGRRLAIVAPDAASRALAAAAGLEVYGTVAEYEAAMAPAVPADAASGRSPDATVEGGTAPGSGTGPAAGAAAAAAMGAAAVAGAAAAESAAATTPPVPPTRPQTGTAARSGARTAGGRGSPPTGAVPTASVPPAASLDGSATVVAAPAGPSGARTAGATGSVADPGGAAGARPAAATAAAAAAAATATGAAESTGGAATAAPAIAEAAIAGPAPAPDLRPRSGAASTGPIALRGGGRPRGPLIAAVVAVGGILLLAGGVAAYLLLPSATIVVRPRVEAVPPVSMTVIADPAATTVDIEAGVVPAETVSLDVQASGTYKATGARVVEAPATGSVRWTNCDPTASYTIKAATTVRTRDRIAFTTDEAVFLPVASIDFTPLPTIKCQSRDVAVTAAKPGPEANVAAGAIRVVPSGVNSTVIQVTNPTPTTGGSRQSFPKVTKADVDKAVADLTKQLGVRFAAQVADPASAPQGTTVFPGTAALGKPTFQADPASFVDQEVATFDLSATASGTVTAVDERQVSQVAAARLRASIDSAHQLVADSVKVAAGEGTVEGQRVRFPATATGQQVAVVDPATIEESVLGLTPEEARAKLAPVGDVRVELSPDWATTIPTYPFRVDVRIEGQPPTETAPAQTAPAPTTPTRTAPAPSGSAP